MIQKHHFFSSFGFKSSLLLTAFLCLTAATTWSQSTLVVSGTQINSSKVYDGTTVAAATPGVLLGLAIDDTVTIATTTAYYGTPVVGTNKAVYVTYTLAGPQASQYVVKPDTLYADIVARQLGITGVHVASKVYDHNMGAILDSIGHLTNLIAADSGLVSHNISCSYINGNAGTLSPVAMQYSIYGTAASNYLPPVSDTIFATILPRTIYASGVEAQNTKVYDGTTSFVVTNNGVIDSGNVLDGDTVYHTAYVNSNLPNQTNGFSKQLFITFQTSGPQGGNYILNDTIDHLMGSISKLDVEIEYPIIKIVKEVDGNDTAEIITPATALNFIEGDTVQLTTVATYDNAEVGYDKPITVHFTLEGPQAFNYNAPADTVISTSGAIIYPTVLDTTNGSALMAEVSGYCEGDSVRLKYHLLTGHPTGYRLVFSDEAIAQGFENTVWLSCTPADSIISFAVPANCQGGDYEVSLMFVNLASVISDTYTSSYTINLTNKYLVQVFDDILSIDNSGRIDNQPDRFTTFKWYHNDQLIDETKAYHQEIGGLTGTYYVIVNEGTDDENVICPWDESMYVVSTPRQVVHVNPSPVVDQAQVKLQGEFESETHLLRVYNSFGTEVLSTTFTGRAYTLNMSAMPQGTYLINVDGVTAKTIKL